MSRLEIDPDRCTGHGRCYDLAPNLFEADEYGHGRVVRAAPEASDAAEALKAVQACPEQAIRFVS